MIACVVAIELGSLTGVPGVVSGVIGDATEQWCLRSGCIGNGSEEAGPLGVRGAMGKAIVSEDDDIRSGM